MFIGIWSMDLCLKTTRMNIRYVYVTHINKQLNFHITVLKNVENRDF